MGCSRGDCWPEVCVPAAEGLFKRTVQDVDSDGEKRLDGKPVPAHLLFLDHPFGDNLVNGGLNPSYRNRLISSIALAVIRQGVSIRIQILQ